MKNFKSATLTYFTGRFLFLPFGPVAGSGQYRASEANGVVGGAACARAGPLEIGTAYRGSVVRQDRIDHPPTWLASVNAAYLGEYLDRATAMARVEEDIEHNMQMVLDDWGLY